MEVVGIGLDIVQVERVRRALARQGERFAQRILGPQELAELERRSLPPGRQAEFLAGRFAAKEAVAKAVGTGVGRLGLGRIEIRGDGSAPRCRLLGVAAALAQERGVARLLVTITHDGAIAAACAVAMGSLRGEGVVPAPDVSPGQSSR